MDPEDEFVVEGILEEMMEPEAIFEIDWPGGSGLTDEQIMKIHEYIQAGIVTKILDTPQKWIFRINIGVEAPWLWELVQKQQKEFNDSLN
ncbi:MAG: hypothetical protein AAB556_00045 [Patescibacteria group bacterium]